MAEALLIAAPASGTGKTLLTLSLLALLRARGVEVAAAKVGPDYIDPAFHAAACGRPCINLDPWAMSRAELAHHLNHAAQDAELLLIEGVMGLFDGAATTGEEQGAEGPVPSSSADLAAMFSIPVILVLDCARQGQSVAALARGFAEFRADVQVAGVILNNLASPRHGEVLAAAVEHGAGLPVVGRFLRRPALRLESRHLGLVQAAERADLEAFLATAARAAAQDISPCRLANLTRPLAAVQDGSFQPLPPLAGHIAVARDEAFAFAYPHLLQGWWAQAAEISFFSPLADEAPAQDAGAVFLPGGYPELHAGRLSAAHNFMSALRSMAERGTLIYGECGGFMTLGESLTDESGATHAMAGLLPLSTSFAERRLHLGYRRLRHAGPLPFPPTLRGHEFHYATITARGDAPALFTAADAAGNALPDMGLRRGSVMGSFAHVISADGGTPEAKEAQGA